jgi:hypothetical protein
MQELMATCCWSREFDSSRKLFADAIMKSVAIAKANGPLGSRPPGRHPHGRFDTIKILSGLGVARLGREAA